MGFQFYPAMAKKPPRNQKGRNPFFDDARMFLRVNVVPKRAKNRWPNIFGSNCM